MRVLLAIKEEYASKIFAGSKKYEFRKSIFKDTRVNVIVVYVSSQGKLILPLRLGRLGIFCSMPP